MPRMLAGVLGYPSLPSNG